MKFISKLYFNAFKRIGNLRLMFVVSCLCSLICFWVVSDRAFNEEKVFVHIYNDNTNTQELYKELINLRDYNMGSISKYTDEEKYKLKNFYIYRLCKIDSVKAFETAENWFNNVGQNKEFDNSIKLCELPPEKMSVWAWSLSYAWNYLWIVFWFYLPFLIVLPIKFIVDGYSEDKRSKK